MYDLCSKQTDLTHLIDLTTYHCLTGEP